MRKLLSVLLVAIMVMTMFIPAFAEDATKVTLKIDSPKEGSSYTAYEILTATEKGVDSDGKPVYTYAVTENFKNFFKTKDTAAEGEYYYTSNFEIYRKAAAGEKDVVIATDAIETAGEKDSVKTVGTATTGLKNTNASDASRFASALEKYVADNKITGTPNVENGVQVNKGYYLVSETSSPQGSATKDVDMVSSKPIVISVLDNTTVKPKDDKVTLEKKIIENNLPVDENDKTIGDNITYRVETSLPNYKADVVTGEVIDESKLKFELSDTFDAGLTYNKDVKVYVGDVTFENDAVKTGTELAAANYTVSEVTDNGFKVSIKTSYIVKNMGQKITLVYTGKLNEDAKVNDTNGNVNKINLVYTNNPNQEDSVGYLKDDVVTYTYGFKLHKVDATDDTKDMAGAEFKIYKKNEGAADTEPATAYDDKTPIAVIGYDQDGKITISETLDGSKAQTGVAANYATISGLDAGKYVIVETNAPSGYAKISEVVNVTITEIKDGENLTGKAMITVNGGGEATEESKLNELQVKQSADGAINMIAKLVNYPGVSLPETGAMTALYMMIGGAVLLIVGVGAFVAARKLEKK